MTQKQQTTQNSAQGFVNTLRTNAAGFILVGTVSSFALGLLFSALIARDSGAFAVILLSVILAAAIGFIIRAVIGTRSFATQLGAGLYAALAVHLMTVIGSGSALGEFGVGGGSFGDELMTAFVTPPLGAGLVFVGLIAAAIVSWGPRDAK